MEAFSNIKTLNKPSEEQINRIRSEAAYIAKKKKIKYKPCSMCGFNLYPIQQQHHDIPVSLGGDNSESNLMVLCPNCHAAIHGGYTEAHANNFNENGGLIRFNIRRA